jgi:hypothetical protein
MQEIEVEMWEEKLMGEQAHDLHSIDEWDLSVGLEELHLRMARIEDKCVAESMRL